MNIEIGLIFTAIAGAIGVATFFLGRQSAAKKDGERWGKLQSDIEHMKDDISDIKIMVAQNESEVKKEIDDLRKKTDESLRRLHTRIDDHLRTEHSLTVT